MPFTGYDRYSNRLYKENLVESTRSELYAYDGLNQITSMQRGTLNGTKDGLTGSASRSQAWDFDALGNFDSQTTDTVTKTRTHNKQNEITAIQDATTPTYDANGNLTKDETGRLFKYDAWNRLVEVRDSGSNLLATFRYDGLNRRVRETRGSTTTDLYYSDQWQVLEERVGSAVQSSYAWSPVYVDALIARDRDADGSAGDGLEERLYAAQDANFNVTAVFDTSGTVQERAAYDAFGLPTYLTGSWGAQTSSTYVWNYLHQGLRYDTPAGTYHGRNREYTPTVGRWMRLDPLGFGGGDLNTYRYVDNNPTNQLDPFGLAVSKVTVKPVKQPMLGLYGAHAWPADFELNDNSHAKLGGFVVQHVKRKARVVFHDLIRDRSVLFAEDLDYYEFFVVPRGSNEPRKVFLNLAETFTLEQITGLVGFGAATTDWWIFPQVPTPGFQSGDFEPSCLWTSAGTVEWDATVFYIDGLGFTDLPENWVQNPPKPTGGIPGFNTADVPTKVIEGFFNRYKPVGHAPHQLKVKWTADDPQTKLVSKTP